MSSVDKEVWEMAEGVFDAAEIIFGECGAANDFCHQTGVVFGGTNRIVLTTKGWRADRSYCTPEFLEKFDAYMASP